MFSELTTEVRAAAPAPKVARRAPSAPVEEDDEPAPKPRAKRDKAGPYRVLDADDGQLGTFATRVEAMTFLETDDDADTVVNGAGKVVGRKTGDDNDDEMEDDDA